MQHDATQATRLKKKTHKEIQGILYNPRSPPSKERKKILITSIGPS
jgi:hypothetical protein